jgi:hypothetical protein
VLEFSYENNKTNRKNGEKSRSFLFQKIIGLKIPGLIGKLQ